MTRGQDIDTLSTDLHSVALHLLRKARQDDATFGLSAARLSTLSVLVFGGAQRLTRLAELEQVRPPTMSRMVQAMRRDGLVDVRTAEGDARAREIRATAKGRRLLEKARDARIAHLAKMLRRADPAERAQIAATLELLERLFAGAPG